MTLTKAINGVWGDDRELDILPDGQYLRWSSATRTALASSSTRARRLPWLVSFHVVFRGAGPKQ